MIGHYDWVIEHLVMFVCIQMQFQNVLFYT
jgi:hypothetical protein